MLADCLDADCFRFETTSFTIGTIARVAARRRALRSNSLRGSIRGAFVGRAVTRTRHFSFRLPVRSLYSLLPPACACARDLRLRALAAISGEQISDREAASPLKRSNEREPPSARAREGTVQPN